MVPQSKSTMNMKMILNNKWWKYDLPFMENKMHSKGHRGEKMH